MFDSYIQMRHERPQKIAAIRGRIELLGEEPKKASLLVDVDIVDVDAKRVGMHELQSSICFDFARNIASNSSLAHLFQDLHQIDSRLTVSAVHPFAKCNFELIVSARQLLIAPPRVANL